MKQSTTLMGSTGNLRIAIVFDSGKASCKNSYDSISDASVMDEVNAVMQSLLRLGHKVILIPIGRRFRRFQKEKVYRSLASDLRKANPDVVFNLCETFCGDAKLQTLTTRILDELNIPYTGSPTTALELTTDKTRTKELLASRKIPTPKFRIFSSSNEISTQGLRFPLIVKPNFEDGSVGIEADSVVHDSEQLKRKTSHVIQTYMQPALVEEYIDGRELNVAVFMNNGSTEVLPISEIVFKDFPEGLPKITSYTAKWVESSREYKSTKGICPSDLPKGVETRVKRIAMECAKASGCRDYLRVDMRLDSSNRPHVIEINANPDISPGEGFMRSFSHTGRTYDDFVRELLSMAMERKGL